MNLKTERQKRDCFSTKRFRARKPTCRRSRTNIFALTASLWLTITTGRFVRAFPTPFFPLQLTMSPNTLRRSPRLQQLLLSTETTASESTTSRKDEEGLLQAWLRHSSTDFHAFSAAEAAAIRHALLVWYRQHRRKLPWRGDPPPWQGSTVDFAKKKKSVKGAKQQHMTDFFETNARAKQCVESSERAPDVGSSSSSNNAFPVTANGIWVSEVMLQQTRIVRAG